MDDDTLYAISRTLTNELRGCTLSDACKVLPDLLRRMEGNDEILRGLYGYFAEGQQATRNPHVAVGGTSNMLSYPEYSDVDKARSFLSLMETRDKLAEIVRGNGELAFTVRIGPETGVPEMADCSIVTATYSTRGGQQGTIGVIGPTRMRKARRIPKGRKSPLKESRPEDRELDEANAKAAEYLAMAQRVQADFENFRRRNESVRADSLRGRKGDVAAMLPVLDNLERAVEAAAGIPG